MCDYSIRVTAILEYAESCAGCTQPYPWCNLRLSNASTIAPRAYNIKYTLLVTWAILMTFKYTAQGKFWYWKLTPLATWKKINRMEDIKERQNNHKYY